MITVEKAITGKQRRQQEGLRSKLTYINIGVLTCNIIPDAFAFNSDHISIKVSDQKGPISSAEGKTLEKSIGATPSIRKAATFADDKQSKHAISTRQESRGPKQEMKRQILAKPAVRDSEADAWEKSEMAKLEKR